MEIDIINYTPEQYAVLSSEALEKIRTAQQRKDGLRRAFLKRKETEKQKMLDRGCFSSNVWTRLETEMREEYEEEVQTLKDNLLFFLHYADNVYRDEENTTRPDVPYPVDYSLSEEERTLALKEYYTNAYDDAGERFDAFNEDSFARNYLGERYAALWHYFEMQV